MDEKEIKVKLVIDDKALNDFKTKLDNTIGGIKAGTSSLNKVNKSNTNIELEKIKIAKEQLKLDVARKKETERLLKIEEKRSKQLDKQTKEITLFGKMLNKLGFKGSATGEIVRGGFRELGVGIVNTVGETATQISGGWINGNGFLQGAGAGALIGSRFGGVAGGLIGGIAGSVYMGLIKPTVSKLTESFGELMTQQREALLKTIPRGDIPSQLQATQDTKQYQARKNQLMLASEYKLSNQESGRFVSVLGALGVDAIGFYKQALKLSKDKGGEFYGRNPTEIMDLLITGISSKQYTKEQRVANYNKFQRIEGVKDLFNGADINALEYAIRGGNLENIIKEYNKQGIQEASLNKAIDKAYADDITTNLEKLKATSDFVVKNIDKVIAYENSITALNLKFLESTKALQQETDFYTQTVKLANDGMKAFTNTITGGGGGTGNNIVQPSSTGAGSLFNPFR